MRQSKDLWWWKRMTPGEQDKYIKDHPNTDLRPTNSSNKQEHLVNPDRARATALVKKIQSARKNLVDKNEYEGMPSGASDLIRHLKTSDNQKSKDFLKKMKSSWDSVSNTFKGKVTNPDLLKIWSAHLNKNYANDIDEVKNSLKNDKSPTASHALSSINSISNAHKIPPNSTNSHK